ncbi:MAG: hypothetical protein QM729_17335 [Solirubrobacterales bacterium]
MAERTKWSDERLDDLVKGVDRRFDEVGRRFDRVEGDIKDLRSLNWWLWATTILAILGLFVTVLLRT